MIERPIAAAVISFLLAGVAACAPLDEPPERGEPTERTQDLYMRRNSAWPTTWIPVCFVNPTEANAGRRADLRAIVDREYGARTPVRFHGWGACEGNGFSAVRIELFEENTVLERTRSFTYYGLPNPADRRVMRLNLADRRDGTILHELGHALSFYHEQDRPDSTCHDRSEARTDGVKLGDYDADSIMNYCARANTLSDQDVAVLQALYGAIGGRAPGWPDGLYQRDGEAAVWKVDGEEICALESAEHLSNYGSFDQVTAVDAGTDLWAGKVPKGPCAWPEGLYMRASDTVVWRLRSLPVSHGDAHLPGSGVHAALANGDILIAHGGLSSVRIVPDDAQLVANTSAEGTDGSYPDGFYRRAGDLTVYLRRGTMICAVESGAQLEAFDGGGPLQVHVVSDADLGAPGTFAAGATGAGLGCGWPDGNYRVAGSPDVWRLRSGRLCHVLPGQPESFDRVVRDVPAGSAIDRGRVADGDCAQDGIYDWTDETGLTWRYVVDVGVDGASGSYCLIQNDQQLAVLANGAAIEPIHSPVAPWSPQGFGASLAYAGECAWPNGFYAADGGFYQAFTSDSTKKVCFYDTNDAASLPDHATTIALSPGSVIVAGRTFQGPCGDALCPPTPNAVFCQPAMCGESRDACGFRHLCQTTEPMRTPITRMADTWLGGHFYTRNPWEASWLVAWAGWQVEINRAFYTRPLSGGPTSFNFELYRCRQSNGRRLITAWSNCEGNGVIEDSMGFVRTSAGEGAVPLYRLDNLANGDHLYTTSAYERYLAMVLYGYSDYGITGYVWQDPGPAALCYGGY